MADTANSERGVFSLGDPTVTARCEKTGRLFEVGSGALPHTEQTSNFLREAARDGDMPKHGEICGRTGRPYETGSGCLTKTAQTAAFLREANPAQAKLDDTRASTVETASEVKQLAAVEEAQLAEEEAASASLANPFDPFVTDPIVIPTKH
jgi:hypothetical protein